MTLVEKTYSAKETYDHIVQAAVKKSKQSWVALLLKSFGAGAWLGIYGHVCTYVAGHFYSPTMPDWLHSLPKLLYAMIFPGGLIAIVFTGSELFTSDTLAMMLGVLDRKVSILQFFKITIVALLMNWVGTAVVAGFSTLAGTFGSGTTRIFLAKMVSAKVNYKVHQILILALGCNMLVCGAYYGSAASPDAPGKILSIYIPIMAFVIGGFEHIVANFYTLTLGWMEGVPDATFGNCMYNWAPCCLGNLIAGALLFAFIGYFSFNPIPCLNSTPKEPQSSGDATASTMHKVLDEESPAHRKSVSSSSDTGESSV